MEFKGVIFRCEEEVDESLLEKLSEDLQEFYRSTNGIVAYNGGLQLRSCTRSNDWHSLHRYWQGEMALYKTYPSILTSDIPFGQDCVGDQYFLRDDVVWLLGSETGEVMDMETDLQGFLENSIKDPVEYLAMEPLVYHLDTEGPLQPGELIHVTPGLSLDLPEETEYHIDSLPIDERLEWLHDHFIKHHLNTV